MHTIQCFRKDKVNGIILICLEQPRWENWMHFIVTVRVKLRGFGEVTSICFYSVALHPIPWQMEKISGYVSIQLIPQVPRLRILTNWLINFSLASCQYKKQIFVLFANFSLELWQIDWNSFSVSLLNSKLQLNKIMPKSTSVLMKASIICKWLLKYIQLNIYTFINSVKKHFSFQICQNNFFSFLLICQNNFHTSNFHWSQIPWSSGIFTRQRKKKKMCRHWNVMD